MDVTVYGLETNKRVYLQGKKTAKAYLARVYTLGEFDGGKELWLPKSQVEIDNTKDTIDVSQWYFSNVLKGKVYA